MLFCFVLFSSPGNVFARCLKFCTIRVLGESYFAFGGLCVISRFHNFYCDV